MQEMCLDQFRLSQLLFHISARSSAAGSGRRRILGGVHYADSPTPPVAVAPFPPTDGGFHDPRTTSTFRLVSDPLLFPRKQILLQYGFAFRFSFCLSDQLQESWCSISILANCLLCIYHDRLYIPVLACPFPSASPMASWRLSMANWDDDLFFLALDCSNLLYMFLFLVCLWMKLNHSVCKKNLDVV